VSWCGENERSRSPIKSLKKVGAFLELQKAEEGYLFLEKEFCKRKIKINTLCPSLDFLRKKSKKQREKERGFEKMIGSSSTSSSA